jgi:hypothetical protein
MGYKTIPVDEETYEMVKELCVAYEMGKRAHGAMVKKVVRAEYQKLAQVKLIAPVGDSSGLEQVKRIQA